MLANITDWESDPKREAEGVEMDIGRGRVIVMRRAGGGNRAFAIALSESLRRIARGREIEDVPDAELEADLVAIFAQHIVIGWRGFKDEAGKDVPYSRAGFIELTERAPDLWVSIRAFAKTRENFQAKEVEADKVKLGKSSRGKRNGGASLTA